MSSNCPINKIILILFSVLLLKTTLLAQNEIIDFDSEQWIKNNAKVVEHLGRKAIMGIAFLKDVEFENGIIEVDIATDEERSYPGVLFRIQNFQNYERFYIRPHRQHLYNDAAQYVAAFNGIDSWQLYNGEGESSLIDIPANQWNHLKIVVSGSQAKIYWIDMENPALEIPHLAHGVSKGFLGLNGPMNGTAYFSNFSYKKDDTIKFEPAEPIREVIGAIRDWEISQVFSIGKIDLKKTPSRQGITDITWQQIKSDVKGMVDVSHHYPRLNPVGDAVFAKTIIKSDEDKIMDVSFGYSDYISIFLNGQPLFFGGSAYRLRDPSFLGIVGYFDDVFLPLKKGDNELVIMVAETFGGWAFQFRDENAIKMDACLTKLWEVSREIQMPESVVYDAKRNICYVTSYFNSGKELIAQINLKGEIVNPEWVTGLNRPTGMIIHNDKLYAVDRKNLHEIDIDKGVITNTYEIPNAAFPNDIGVDADGYFYITDSNNKSIYKFKDGNFDIWIQGDEIANPNGILIDGDKAIVGISVQGCLKSIDLKTKEMKVIAKVGKDSIMDGIKSLGNGSYLFTDYNGRLFKVSKNGETKELMNSTTPQGKLADFEFIKDKNLLIIPTLEDNRIMYFEMK